MLAPAGINKLRLWAAFLGLWVLVSTDLSAQTFPTSVGRKLAPDALNTIPPTAEWGETVLGPVDLPLVPAHPELQWTPNYSPKSDTLISKSKDVNFRNDVYCLEFSFKPVRMIQVGNDLVWYLLYRVRYMGGDLRPEPQKDNFGNNIYANPQAVSAQWVRFVPSFTLTAIKENREYIDEINPAAKALIAAKERVGAPIYDSIEIISQRIDLTTELANKEVWGVATWRQVDPRTDFFSVRVKGLTNAQKLVLKDGQFTYPQKSLVLYFSRPGDTINQTEDQIRFGVPAHEDPVRQKYILDQYGLKERLDYMWIYR